MSESKNDLVPFLDTKLDDSSEPPRPVTAKRGDSIGRFIVLDKLGEGGMGVVLSAYDGDLDRRVAIKLLHPGTRGTGTSPEAARARLLREAQAMAKLRHPNVVTIYDVGTVGDGVFLAMEHVEGGNLRTWIREKTAAMSWRQIVDHFISAGRGLAAAHAKGLVHRDFKPENVLVGKDGRLQVADFGLVSMHEKEDLPAQPSVTAMGSSSLTKTGAVMGTPMYMAPEQHKTESVDARTDQYAFCIALYEALYGTHPFAGALSMPEFVATVLSGDFHKPPKNSDVPAWVLGVLRRGLSVDPEQRYESMDQLVAELERREDTGVGDRTRVFLTVVSGLLWTAGPASAWVFGMPWGLNSHLGTALVTGTLLVVSLALLYWARESMLRTVLNRQVTFTVTTVLVAQLVFEAGTALAGIDYMTSQVLHLFLWFVSTTLFVVLVEIRTAPTALGYLVGFFFAAAYPEYRYLAMAGANFILTVNALLMWGPAMRRQQAAEAAAKS